MSVYSVSPRKTATEKAVAELGEGPEIQRPSRLILGKTKKKFAEERKATVTFVSFPDVRIFPFLCIAQLPVSLVHALTYVRIHPLFEF